MEAFSPRYRDASDFLIAIAEPVSRPNYIHEYMLTPYSLYAAVSVGLTKEYIFKALSNLMKNAEIPYEVREKIELYSGQYGKARLVLKDTNYYIEPFDENTR